MKRFLLCILIFGLFAQCSPKANRNNHEQKREAEQISPQSTQREETETSNEVPEQKDVPIVEEGTTWSLFNSNGEEVKITVKSIYKNRREGGTLNITLKLRIENKSSSELLVSNLNWMLVDENMTIVEEGDCYDPSQKNATFDWMKYSPGTFFFTIVNAGFAKEELVGYDLNPNGHYYIHMGMNSERFGQLL